MPTGIQWCDETWNPIVGCGGHVSPGCKHCYAERMAQRLACMAAAVRRTHLPAEWLRAYEEVVDPETARWTGETRLILGRLAKPRRWRRPRRVFVNSMGDLASSGQGAFLAVWRAMQRAPQHEYLLLTKRPSMLAALIWEVARSPDDGPPRLGVGVTVEQQETLWRADVLDSRIPATVRFVSCEPLLGPIDLRSLQWGPVDWVLVGGETGPGARPMAREWVEQISRDCLEAGVPYFFKQWGAGRKRGDAAPDALVERREWPVWERMGNLGGGRGRNNEGGPGTGDVGPGDPV